MILNTKRIHNSFWRNFPVRAKQTPSEVLFVGKKKRRPRSFGHRARRQNCNRWQQENELKIIIFVLNYLTVLGDTKTSLHLGVGG